MAIAISNQTVAKDIVYLNKAVFDNDQRMAFKLEILNTALQKTQLEYGDFDIVEVDLPAVTPRAKIQVQSGENINLMMAVTTNELESSLIPIRIPIRRGILNYRLIVTTQDNLTAFSNISALEDLKEIKVGLKSSWATTALFKLQHFNVIEIPTLNGVFKMVSAGRAKYVPRGINEVYHEIKSRQHQLNNLVIEPTLALYIKAPYYVFVSPKHPELAKRLELGLETMVKDGSHKAIFNKYFQEKIKLSELENRKVIVIKTPHLSGETPLERKELWFEYDEL